MQQNMTGTFSVPCSQSSNLAAYLRVKIDATYGLALAGASDNEIGVLANTWVATGLGSSKYATLCGSNAGVAKYTAHGSISQYAAVYAAANGQVAGSGTLFLGYALDAGTASGDIIRVSRDWPKTSGVTPNGIVNPTVATLAAAGTVSASPAQIASQIVTVTASTGTKAVKLPNPATYGFVQIVNTVATATLPVAQYSGENIDGTAAAVTMPAGSRVMFFSDGTNWWSTLTTTFGLPPIATGISAGQTVTQAGATALTAKLNVVSTSAAAGAVKLPAPAAGLEITVVNATGQTITIFGNGSETISGTAGATGVSATTGKTLRVVSDGTNWFGPAAA